MRTTAPQREASIAKVLVVTSAEMTKVRSKRDSAATFHLELFLSILRIVEARGKRKFKGADSLAKLRKGHYEGRKDRVESHVAE